MRLIIFTCFLFISTAAFADDDEPVIVAEGFGPSACGMCDGYINFFFTNVNDGLAIINSSNGGPYSVFISGGIAVLLGMCEGDYNGLYVVVNGCLSPPVDVSVSLPLPPPPTSAGATYCTGEPILDVFATGFWGENFTWYSDQALTNIIANGAIYTPLGTIGTETVYVTETVSGCESEATQVDIVVEVTPTIVASANNPSACGLQDGWIDLVFTGVPNGVYDIAYNGGVWSAVEVTGGLATINSLGDGIYNNIQIVLGSCPSALGENVVLTTDGAPSAPSATGSVYCADEPIADITATGDAGAVFTWYYIDPITSEATIVDNDATWTPSGIIGTETVYVTQTIGACESITTEVVVNVIETPFIDALPNVFVCENYTLPNFPTGLNLTENAGFFQLPNGVNPIPGGSIISNTQTIYIYDANGNCSYQQEFLVAINESPDLQQPPSVIACDVFDLTTVIPVDINSTGVSSYTYHIDAGGAAGAILESTDITASGDYYIVGAADACADTTFVNVTIVALESPEAEGGNYCFGWLIPDVSASGEAAANFTWYDMDPSLPGATVIGTEDTYQPNGTIGTETVYVTQTVAGCQSAATEVSISINECVNIEDLVQQQIIVSQASLSGELSVKGELSYFNQIDIISLNGSIIKSQNIEPFTNQMSFDIPSGMYIIRFWSENGVYSKKVVVN